MNRPAHALVPRGWRWFDAEKTRKSGSTRVSAKRRIDTLVETVSRLFEDG